MQSEHGIRTCKDWVVHQNLSAKHLSTTLDVSSEHVANSNVANKTSSETGCYRKH